MNTAKEPATPAAVGQRALQYRVAVVDNVATSVLDVPPLRSLDASSLKASDALPRRIVTLCDDWEFIGPEGPSAFNPTILRWAAAQADAVFIREQNPPDSYWDAHLKRATATCLRESHSALVVCTGREMTRPWFQALRPMANPDCRFFLPHLIEGRAQ